MTNKIDPASRPLLTLTEDGEELITTGLHSEESLDGLFEHRAVVLAKKLSETDLLGQEITFCYQPETASSRMRERWFHGFCVQVQQIEPMDSRDYIQYELVAAPWAWFLTRRSNCRVFQQQKTSEIITLLCREHGFHPFLELRACGDQRREYCVQFNETDWEFIERLINEEGWFFFFQQYEGKHQLVVGDNNRLFADSGETDVEYFVGSSKLERAVIEWIHQYQMQTGSVITADYNYELMEAMLTDEGKSSQKLSRRKQLQQYFYPGCFQEKNQGNRIATQNIERLDNQVSEVAGRSALYRFAAGTLFRLEHHPDSQEQQQYLLRKVEHTLRAQEDGHSLEYHNRFFCVPASIPWRAGERKPKPVMAGVQSATVTGPDNEEVYLDKYHRIKVQFHWDREGKNDQNSSCWLRVAQALSGDGFGCQFTPRVGDEVLVCFLDNDPDKPLVIGSVYNGRHLQPYESTNDQGMKLKSFPKADSDNFSELRFTCKKDEELVYLQAEKDMSVMVKNDADRTVQGNNKTLVEKNSDRTVKENDTHKIEGEQSTEVSKNISTKTDASYQLNTADDFDQKTDGNFSLKVKGKTITDSTGDLSLKTSGSMETSAVNSLSVNAASITGEGKSSIELSVGASKVSLSNNSVEISCGPGSVKISPSGVEISGVQVKAEGQVMAQVKGGVSASLEGTVNTEVKGTMVTINGNAMTSVKAGALVELSGAIAKIN